MLSPSKATPTESRPILSDAIYSIEMTENSIGFFDNNKSNSNEIFYTIPRSMCLSLHHTAQRSRCDTLLDHSPGNHVHLERREIHAKHQHQHHYADSSLVLEASICLYVDQNIQLNDGMSYHLCHRTHKSDYSEQQYRPMIS